MKAFQILLIVVVGIALLVGSGLGFYWWSQEAFAAPVVLSEGLTADWQDGSWLITATLTDTGSEQGTTITFTANVTYTRDGQQISTDSEPVTLTVGASELTKQWTTTEPVSLSIVEGSANGSGGCEQLPDGRLRWWVSAPNDGLEKTFSFRVR